MKSYLTYKGKNTPLTWIGLATWGVLAWIGMEVVIDSIPEGAMSVFAAMIVEAPFLAGLILQIYRIYYRYYAAKIDQVLGGVHEESISLQRLEELTGIQDIARYLVPILQREMMEDIKLDTHNTKVILPENVRPAQRYVAIVCPHCGATNRVPADVGGTCEYCSQFIQVNTKRDPWQKK